MQRSRIILTLLGIGALVCAVVAAWWWFGAERLAYYTNDADIRTSADEAAVRDVLWRTPEPLQTVSGEPIEGRDPVISADGDTLLLTRTSETGDRDLYIAGRVGEAWTEPRPLSELNTIDNELSPAISADGQRLYFASDRAGGQGGLDIWLSIRDGDRWGEPTPLALNTRDDETDPHPFIIDNVESVLFASDRATEADTLSFDLYLSGLDSASPRHLRELSGPANDVGPAVTPAGDFVYFASDRDEGAGGYDLYRARIRRGTDGTLAFDPPRTLGPSINTAGDDLDPSLGLEGFAIQFAMALDESHTLMRAVSREVYLARNTTRGDLLSLLPWILMALALVMLLALLHRTVRSEAWRARIATLGLMAKCVLASLIVHACIAALLAALHVPPTVGEPNGKQGVQVALTSSAVRSSIASQMRGDSSPAALEQAATAPTPLPSISSNASPSAVTFQPQQTSAPTGAPLTPATASRDSTTPAAPRFDATGDVQLPESGAAAPSLTLPAVAAAEAPAQPEAGIESPSLADTGASIDQFVIEPTAGAAATTALLDAAATPVRDTSTFMPSTTVADAQPSAAHDAPPGDSAPISIPDALVAAPALAMPSTAGKIDATDEVDAGGPVLAEAGPALPTLSGTETIETLSLDAAEANVHAADATQTLTTREADPTPSSLDTLPSLQLPALAFVTPELTMPDAPQYRFELLGIVIDDATEAPIAGAQVRLDLEGEADLTDRTADDGTFVLGFDRIPDNAALTAAQDGYTPGMTNIAQRDLEVGRRIVVRLKPFDPHVIIMEPAPEVHHLGNDDYSGQINSQFQRRSEGLVLQIPFEMTRQHAALPLRGAELWLFVKGTQSRNPVRLNGNLIATLAQSPSDGSFGEQVVTIPSGILRMGQNVLEIQSVARSGSDYDDFEFVNPRVVLLVREDQSPIDEID